MQSSSKAQDFTLVFPHHHAALFFARSYYIAEIWGSDASPNFWGFFSVDGPYTLVNLMMMFVIFVTDFLCMKSCRHRLRADIVFAMLLRFPAQTSIRILIEVNSNRQLVLRLPP